MLDEIVELWKLVEECREWARNIYGANPDTSREFIRIAKQLDDIANRLAGRMPT